MKCRKCNGEMKLGIALQNTYVGKPDFIGGEAMTMNYGGSGKLVSCLKCKQCGHSITHIKT